MKIKGIDVHVAGPLYAFLCGVVLPTIVVASSVHGASGQLLGQRDALTFFWASDALRFVAAIYFLLMASVYWPSALDDCRSMLFWKKARDPINADLAPTYRSKVMVQCAVMGLFYLGAVLVMPGPFFSSGDTIAAVKMVLAFGLLGLAVFPGWLAMYCLASCLKDAAQSKSLA